MTSSTIPATLSNTRWIYLWNTAPTGECLCPRGGFHYRTAHAAYSGSRDCGSAPGKHPWHIWKRGEITGFRHGAQDSIPYPELLESYGEPGGSRRFGMCLNEVIMLDIDSLQALQSFYRIARHVPADDRLLGIAKTPRGYHLYLYVPGWTQKAVSAAMRAWLGTGMWDGADETKIARRGLILDVRTGAHRYTVWPGPESRDRRWVPSKEFREQLKFAGQGMPAARMVQDGTQAPWNLEMNDALRERIARAGTDNVSRPKLTLDGSEADRSLALHELRKWADLIAKMGPDTGRNNSLNRTAYHSGADAIAAGIPEEHVREILLTAAQLSHTPGAEATITSGLTSGLRDRYARI